MMMSKTKKVVRINSMRISNFKGIKDLLVDLDGSNAIVKGDNGTGKTTLYDALLWVLFEKDSKGRTDFGVKPVDKDGNEIHHLETSVEVKLSVDGVVKTFKRLLKEKWQSRPGETEKIYNGNDTQWYVDGLKLKTKKSYNEEVNKIVDESVFRYITNIYHFLSLNTKDQRALLTQIVGAIDDEEIIKQDDRFNKVEEYLDGQPIDHVIAVLKQNISESKKRNESIPSLIEENFNQIKPFEKVELSPLEKELSDLQQQLFNVRNGAAVSTKKQEIEAIQHKLSLIESAGNNSAMNEAKAKLQESESNVTLIKQKVEYNNQHIDALKNEIERFKKGIENIQSQQEALRFKWKEINEQQSNVVVETTCPTCKQDLQVDKVEEVKQETFEQFNLQKSKISEEGKALGSRITDGELEIKKVEENLQAVLKEREKNISLLEQADKALVKAKDNIEKVTKETESYKSSVEYQTLQKELDEKNKELETLNESAQEVLTALETDIANVKSDISKALENNAQEATNKALQKRITELKTEMSKLGQNIIDQEIKLHVLLDFADAKMKQVEININNLFTITKFKMFEPQINGGVKDVCQATYNGVAVNKGLNTAATINVGLDIVNALSTYYGVTAPVFIDNAESITNIIDSDSQLIKMYVTPQENLTVEKEGNL